MVGGTMWSKLHYAILVVAILFVGSIAFGQNPLGDVRILTWGSVAVTNAAALSDAIANPTAPSIGAHNLLWDTAQWVREQAADLSTMPASSTTTGRNSLGAAIVEKGSRWSVVSFPAANSQGSASIAAEASVRHVMDCISWGADASAAVAAAAGNIAIRDGASGAGTIIWQVAIAHLVAAAAGVQTIAPQSFCGLGLVGTTNTAMTAEFNAGVTGEVQSVSISGYNVN